MTYCIAIKTPEGIVFASDTRTNAGLDNIQRHRKIHNFESPGELSFTMLSAGSLSTTQSVLSRIQADLKDSPENSILACQSIFEIAEYVAELSLKQQQKTLSMCPAGLNVGATFIIGGQFLNQNMELLVVTDEGEIKHSTENGYLHSGITFYGAECMNHVDCNSIDLNQASKNALWALATTSLYNLSVAAPYDIAIQFKDDLKIHSRLRIDEDNEVYKKLHQAAVQGALENSPLLPWEYPNQCQSEVCITLPSNTKIHKKYHP